MQVIVIAIFEEISTCPLHLPIINSQTMHLVCGESVQLFRGGILYFISILGVGHPLYHAAITLLSARKFTSQSAVSNPRHMVVALLMR